MGLSFLEEDRYHNGDWYRRYSCSFSCKEEFFSLIRSLESDFGTLTRFMRFRRTGEKTIHFEEFYETSDMLFIFLTDEQFKSAATINFSCKNRYVGFKFSDKKIFSISNCEHSLGKRIYDPDKICFYKDSYGNLYLYDSNDELLFMYGQSDGKWYLRLELFRDFFSYDNDYEYISKEEAAKEMEASLGRPPRPDEMKPYQPGTLHVISGRL